MPKYRRGSGTVYRRGKTYWLAYFDQNGTRIFESARTADKAEARRVLQAKLGQIAEGRFTGPAADRVTFDDLAEGLLKDYEVNGKKSLPDTEARVRLHLRPFFGGKRAHAITSADVSAFIAHRKEQGASNAEVNREIAALKRAFNLAHQAERILRKLHFPRLEEDNARQGFFESWEFEAVLVRLPEYYRAPVTWAYYTGWRMYSEILPLSCDRVDLEAGTVRLYRGTTKNKQGRVIALPQVLRAILEQQWQTHFVHYPLCPWVFHNNGARLQTFYKAWNRACTEAGISGKKLIHDFRRTAVRNLVRAGVPERVAMMITGHKTRDVFERYNIVSAGDLEEAARRVDAQIAVRSVTNFVTVRGKPEEGTQLSS